jgi:hypothetical protein
MLAKPFRLNLGAVYIDIRYGTIDAGRPREGWTCRNHTQPLAATLPSSVETM